MNVYIKSLSPLPGKTALHWAASVNNVAAAKVLLHHGANRDAQDDKVSVFSLPLITQGRNSSC